MTRLLVLLALAATAVLSAPAQTWTRDPQSPVLRNDTSVIPGMVTAPDGRVLLVGTFTHFSGGAIAARQLAYVRSDGTPDPTFTSAVAAEETILAAAPMLDGGVLAQRARRTDATTVQLVRYLPNGDFDPAFAAIDCPSPAHLALAPDGRVLVWSSQLSVNGSTAHRLVRLTARGELDATFNERLPAGGTPVAAAVGADGRIVVLIAIPGASARLLRLNNDGSVDLTFAAREFPDATYHAFAIQTDGKVIVGSSRGTATLTRCNADGSEDGTFKPQLPGVANIQQIAVTNTGQIVVQALVGGVPGPYAPDVFLLDQAGTLVRDLRTTFGNGEAVQLGAVLSDGAQFVVHGAPVAKESFGPIMTTPAFGPDFSPVEIPNPLVARVAGDGLTATALDVAPLQRTEGYVGQAMADGAGRLLITGQFTAVDGIVRAGLARFTASGALDVSYAPDLGPAKIQSVLVLGPAGDAIVQLLQRGDPDANGVLTPTRAIARLTANGAVDRTFIAPTTVDGAALAWQAIASDGRVLVSTVTVANSGVTARLAWLDRTGALASTLPTRFAGIDAVSVVAGGGGVETSAPTSTGANSSLVGVVPAPNPFRFVQPLPDGKILVGGAFRTVNDTTSPFLVRLNADGTIDPTYRPDTAAFTGQFFPSLASADGKVEVAGPAVFAGVTQPIVYRLLPDGTRDPAFHILPAEIRSISIRTDGVLTVPPLYRDDGLPDLNFPRLGVGPDGKVVPISSAVRTGPDAAWTIFPFSRYTASDSPTVSIAATASTVAAGRDVSFVGSVGTRDAVTYQWLHDDQPIPGATLPYLSLTGVSSSQGGRYRLRVTVDGQTAVSDALSLTVTGGAARLVNFSARAAVSAGAPAIAGFAIAADGGERPWLLRATGPSLTKYGVTNVVPDPQIALFRGAAPIASNAGGAEEPAAIELARQVGAFPLFAPFPHGPEWHTGESALVSTYASGNYTAHLSSTSSRSGIALLELYDSARDGASGGLVNVSFRGRTASGTEAATVGFVISGNSYLTLLIRGAGPALRSFGVDGAISDPRLSVTHAYSAIATNAGWADAAEIAAASRQAGAFAFRAGSHDAALLLRLSPGAYTAQLTSASGASGDGLLEVYVLDR
jgi:uncharacterized delta-60 repeat protein